MSPAEARKHIAELERQADIEEWTEGHIPAEMPKLNTLDDEQKHALIHGLYQGQFVFSVRERLDRDVSILLGDIDAGADQGKADDDSPPVDAAWLQKIKDDESKAPIVGFDADPNHFNTNVALPGSVWAAGAKIGALPRTPASGGPQKGSWIHT